MKVPAFAGLLFQKPSQQHRVKFLILKGRVAGSSVFQNPMILERIWFGGSARHIRSLQASWAGVPQPPFAWRSGTVT